MNTKIHFGRIGIVFVSLLGIAIIIFLIGKKSIDIVTPVPTEGVRQNAVPLAGLKDTEKTQEGQSQGQRDPIDQNTYKNDAYGFGTIFLAKAETATECPLDSTMAYDPIKEYIFADQPIECARTTEATEKFYNERGGHLATVVFDLKKCRDAKTDQNEKFFCAKYDETNEIAGKTTGKGWPASTWTKSGDFLTFYLDLTLGKNEHWKSDYKFLVLER